VGAKLAALRIVKASLQKRLRHVANTLACSLGSGLKYTL